MRTFRCLECEAHVLKSLSLLELLSEDVKTRWEQAASLIRGYISNGELDTRVPPTAAQNIQMEK